MKNTTKNIKITAAASGATRTLGSTTAAARGARRTLRSLTAAAVNGKSDLMRHKCSHGGAQRNCCDLSGKTFTQNCNLITHKRLHCGERPYCWHVCSKVFIQKSDLIKHKCIDRGECPYCCRVCGEPCHEGSSQGYLHAELNWWLAGISGHTFPCCHRRIGSCEWGEWMGELSVRVLTEKVLPRLTRWSRHRDWTSENMAKLRGDQPQRSSNCSWSSPERERERERGGAQRTRVS